MICSILISHLKLSIQFIFGGQIIAENNAMSLMQNNPDQLFIVNWRGEITFQSSDSTIYPIEHQHYYVAPFVTSWNTLKNESPIKFFFSGLYDSRPVDAFLSISMPDVCGSDLINIGNLVNLSILVTDNAWYENFTINTFGEHNGFNILETNSIFSSLPALSKSGFYNLLSLFISLEMLC